MSTLPLGERLALIANKYSKNATRKRNMNNLQQKLAALPRPVEPSYTQLPSAYTAVAAAAKKNCGPKPAAWIGTQKNPAFEEWKRCSTAPAAGGKRKTRKSKKSKRTTRRHR
jgi:hypothetical protein